jgi:imidazolonepropionase-like amidohydrolase
MERGRIREIGPAVSISPGDEVVELRGAHLVPGLVDAHVHLSRGAPGNEGAADAATGEEGVGPAVLDPNARATLSAGTTGVRSLGDVLSPSGRGWLTARSDDQRPLVVSSGRALTRDGRYGTFLGRGLPEGASLAQAVEEEVAGGASTVKIILSGSVDFVRLTAEGPFFSLAELREAVGAARALGARVACHANGSASVSRAAAAGVDTLEHGILVERQDLRALAAGGVAWVPTLTPLAALARDPRWPALPGLLYAHMVAVHLGLQLGVSILAGTDAGSPGVPHGSLLTEVALLAEAGLGPADLLAAATLAPAEAAGLPSGYGRLEPGAETDLVWFSEDPFRSVEGRERLARPLGLVRAGRLWFSGQSRIASSDTFG